MAATKRGSRQRFQGAAQDLADAFSRVATKRSFLKYSDAERCRHAPTEVGNIEAAHPLLIELHSLSSNLCFAKSVVSKALRLLLEMKADDPAFYLRPEDESNYILTMTRRVVNLCSAVREGSHRPSKAAWVKSLPWATPPAKAMPPPCVDDDWVFGYDPEARSAWRAWTQSGKVGARQYCLEMKKPSEGSGAMLAVFDDGTNWKVTDVTYDDYKQSLREAPSHAQGSGVFWNGEHQVSHKKVTVRTRVDRTLLVSIYEETKTQILQVRADMFDNVDLAGAFMVELAEEWVKGKLSQHELKQMRNERLKQRDLGRKRKRAVDKQSASVELGGDEFDCVSQSENDSDAKVKKKPAGVGAGKKDKVRINTKTRDESQVMAASI